MNNRTVVETLRVIKGNEQGGGMRGVDSSGQGQTWPKEDVIWLGTDKEGMGRVYGA